MPDVGDILKRQIEILEKAQAKALEDDDMDKVSQISHTILSMVNTINQKQ